MPQFNHLHVHTQFSLLDGAASIPSLYKKAQKDGMRALAITDHGNMFGAFQFVAEAYNKKNCDEAGNPKVKPIVGCEFYVVEDRHKRQFSKEDRDVRRHQLLLAKNAEGYQNLVKLCSLGYIEGLYGKYPRIDKELILKYHKGLIATTCCIGAEVPQTILKKGEIEGEKVFKWWLDLFEEDYYVELQRHDIPDQKIVNEVLIKFALKHNVKIIASNDSHYVDREDFNAHDILLCINTGEKQSTPTVKDFDDDVSMKGKRFAFYNDQFYFKTTQEMSTLFSDLPQAIDNTNEIVDKVDLLKLKQDILLPNFPIPKEFIIHADDKMNQWEYLKHITFEGAKKRYKEITTEIEERLNFELYTIKTMGFAGYFLIVGDFIEAGRKMGVLIGPGRGSAAGSAVAYCIGITNIDPIKYDLLFERFLNPDRKSMPDIDTDFDDEGRQKVIDYVVDKYGKNQVAHIVTYGTMAAKMSIKDVARVLDLPLADSNALAKLVPDAPGTQLSRVFNAPLTDTDDSLEKKEGLKPDDLENIKKLREIAKGYDLSAEVLKEAQVLEGSVRGTGIHAAGIIIAPKDLTDIIPVCTNKDVNLLITQYEGKIIEDAGVIKMDFLGLKTLTIIRDALRLIKKNHGIEIDIDNIPLDDTATFELLQKAATPGIFQFEAPHVIPILKDMKPTSIEDLIALNALNRPGPAAYIPNYIKRKHGTEKVVYDLPEMEEYLKETHGITVYQEQVMLLSQKIAGFSKGDADVLRKAMGKKDRATLDKMKAKFIDGAVAKGHKKDICEKIWTDWEAFAQYAFNKSHSTCYAIVAYQTAYLKAHYPAEFMSSVLTHNLSNIDKITFFMEECKRMGLPVLGPDVNESSSDFNVNKSGKIRFGLAAIKGTGDAAVDSIITERDTNGPFKDIFDFITRVNLRTVNKKSLEVLAWSGALDCFGMHRGQLIYLDPKDNTTFIEKLIRYGNAFLDTKDSMENSLFGDSSADLKISSPAIPICEPMNELERLRLEKEVVGFYISGHPLDQYSDDIRSFCNCPIPEINQFSVNKEIKFGGIVTSAGTFMTKNGDPFGKITIEDYDGSTTLMLFQKDYLQFKDFLQTGLFVFVKGYRQQKWKTDQYEFKPNSMCLMSEVREKLLKSLTISLDIKLFNSDFLGEMEDIFAQYKGKSELQFEISDPENNVKVKMVSRKFQLNVSNELLKTLQEMEGVEYSFG